MPFDISPLRMHPESSEHEQNIPASHINVPEYLECTQNAVRILECTSIIKEYTTNFHSDGILAHSGTSVTSSLALPKSRHFMANRYYDEIRGLSGSNTENILKCG